MLLSILIIFLNLTITNPFDLYQTNLIQSEKSLVKRKLIVFSGSDWCKNCIRFKQEVLSNEVFTSFARDNIEIVTVDFPQRKKLSKEEIVRNEALAEKYNREGEFPRLVLLSEDGSDSKIIPYTSQGPEEFVMQLKNQLAR